ncbi:hypothetical protein INT48_008411 [Thamnidium elegans]|uniref:Uncharacterized protein n=1 Tax=Thamnidium elegans TaxID=101142 RepID=A0A8H7VSA0_9FUNG|nr:hypothetical protein INT48_008411 [Thamnidium elegans]
MRTNVYKRAFMIHWLQQNAHSSYALTGGWHIDTGRLLSVPLCISHHAKFQTDWNQRLDMLRDKGIRLESAENAIDVTKFFMNWSSPFRYSKNSLDLSKVQPLPHYPLKLTIPAETNNVSTFNASTFNDI